MFSSQLTTTSTSTSTTTSRKGRIALVGAGPGDVDLLTVGGMRELQEADLVVADELVAPSILALVRGKIIVADKHERGQVSTLLFLFDAHAQHQPTFFTVGSRSAAIEHRRAGSVAAR